LTFASAARAAVEGPLLLDWLMRDIRLELAACDMREEPVLAPVVLAGPVDVFALRADGNGTVDEFVRCRTGV
jgi:hypothetical protein